MLRIRSKCSQKPSSESSHATGVENWGKIGCVEAAEENEVRLEPSRSLRSSTYSGTPKRLSTAARTLIKIPSSLNTLEAASVVGSCTRSGIADLLCLGKTTHKPTWIKFKAVPTAFGMIIALFCRCMPRSNHKMQHRAPATHVGRASAADDLSVRTTRILRSGAPNMERLTKVTRLSRSSKRNAPNVTEAKTRMTVTRILRQPSSRRSPFARPSQTKMYMLANAKPTQL